MFSLEDKTVLITGGAGLLGGAFSQECAKCSANIVIADIDEKAGNNSVRRIKKATGNDNVVFQKCDITDLNDTKNLLEVTLGEFSKIDALVNNAYPRNENYGRRFEDVSFEDFCENLNLHLGGYFLMTKEVSKIMIKQNFGNILNIASIYGFSAPRFEIYEDTDMTVPVEYAAVKGGLITLTKYLAAYLGKYNIRVNAISPGGVFNNQPESFIKKYSEKVLFSKRMATSTDLVGVLVFMISDASRYMTGQNIIVDGGWSL